MATIRVSDLKLRAIIGTNDWERNTKQDVTINVTLEFDAAPAAQSDNLKDTVDYKTMTKKIIKTVEESHFFLLEALTNTVLNIALEDKRVSAASVRVDKPQALRFADSVSLEISRRRDAD